MKVRYIAPCFDSSGYAEAARGYIEALDSVGVEVQLMPMTFERQKPDLGKLEEKLKTMAARPNDARIQIIHMTPENYPRFRRADRYNIAYTTWETNRLPEGWANSINQMQECWVPCEHNVKVFRDSGVKVPIKCIPHTFRVSDIETTTELPLTNKDPSEFTFYSIFQWTERKHPSALIKAYLSEFKADEKVCLVLKTYFVNPDNADEAKQLKEVIKSIKERMYLKAYPKILLISSLLSKPQINSLHQQGDCFVLTHRCEGFGMPIVEAMAAGKPSIYTNYGGPEDFGKGFNSPVGFPIRYDMTPCHGMPWPIYHGHMDWAEPSVAHTREHMRTVFNNRQLAKEVGQTARAWVSEELSHTKIGNLMKTRLEEIENDL
jgi:glycosyltransferase involved in cell wall biosynthesis